MKVYKRVVNLLVLVLYLVKGLPCACAYAEEAFYRVVLEGKGQALFVF